MRTSKGHAVLCSCAMLCSAMGQYIPRCCAMRCDAMDDDDDDDVQ